MWIKCLNALPSTLNKYKKKKRRILFYNLVVEDIFLSMEKRNKEVEYTTMLLHYLYNINNAQELIRKILQRKMGKGYKQLILKTRNVKSNL